MSPLTSSQVFDRDQVRTRAAALAARGVFVGTSSWKYEGWLGQLYTPERYAYRGKLAKTRFQRSCLEEYSEIFRTVCVDAAYYDFPRRDYLLGLADQVPEDFRFGFKVTDVLTVKKFPRLDRFGARAGQANPDFLNADRFATAFLTPCEEVREHVGILMFEFSRFWPTDYPQGRDFVADLDRFLGQLPAGWPFGVEMRNRAWLVPDYFDCLRRHGVAHVYNSWEAMPPVSEQAAMPGSRTCDSLVAARFLLKPGRKYEEAVKTFQPYDRAREVNPEARSAGAKLLAQGVQSPGRQTFVFVNNRLEGNAPTTLAAMIDEAGPVDA